MRKVTIAALAGAAMLMGGCISVVGEPTPSPAAAEPSLVPVVTPAPTPVITLAPGATPSFDIGSILNAEITIYNLTDTDLAVDAVIHDPSADGEDVPISAFTLGPNQVATRSVIGGNSESGPVPYLLSFSYASGTVVGGSCTVSVLAGQEFSFVAVNEGLTITRGDETPGSLDEARIATSSLCVAPPAATP